MSPTKTRIRALSDLLVGRVKFVRQSRYIFFTPDGIDAMEPLCETYATVGSLKLTEIIAFMIRPHDWVFRNKIKMRRSFWNAVI